MREQGEIAVRLLSIFRGFAEGLRGCESANGVVIATALNLLPNMRQSVMAPTEGTIFRYSPCRRCSKESAGVDVPAVKVFEDAMRKEKHLNVLLSF